MEYGYEKKDHRGNLVYPMYPVQEENADNVIAAFIVGNGYVPVPSVTYESEEECRKACDVHNDYHGWTKGEVDAVFFKSITGQYPKETIAYNKKEMSINNWHFIPGFPNYEINNRGDVRYLNGKPLRLYPSKGYSLIRDGKQLYIRPARLLYAVSHGVCPTKIRNLVIIEVNGILTPMTRTEYAEFVNKKRRRGCLNEKEAKEYYEKNIEFSQMMLEYYETRDMTPIVCEISKYENYCKNYIRKMGFSINESIIDEAWDEIIFNIMSNIEEGKISIIEPRSYILKSIRLYFKILRKNNLHIVKLRSYDTRSFNL